jgi:hypothetical protein
MPLKAKLAFNASHAREDVLDRGRGKAEVIRQRSQRELDFLEILADQLTRIVCARSLRRQLLQRAISSYFLSLVAVVSHTAHS